MEKYVVITWPEIQELMDSEGFYDNSYLINDEKGLDEFGSSSYFVSEKWLNAIKEENDAEARLDKLNEFIGVK